MSLVKAVVAGTVAGTSAGSSGQKDSYGTPSGYGAGSNYGGAAPSNGYVSFPLSFLSRLGILSRDTIRSHTLIPLKRVDIPVTLCFSTFQPKAPPKHPNSLDLLGSSVKDILNAILKVVASLVSAITTILGASSNSSNEPTPYYPTPPRTYGKPNPDTLPLSESISITTSRPERLVRL